MADFHIAIHVRGQTVRSDELRTIDSLPVRPLSVPPGGSSDLFLVSFEETCQRWTVLPQMFVEPDGSFIWTGAALAQPWQVEGCLYDRQSRLQYVELWGSCPESAFETMLTTLGWPSVAIMIQLVREAVFVDEADFRRIRQFPQSF